MIKVKPLVWWMIALPVLLLALLLAILCNMGDYLNTPLFAPVPYDPDAVVNPADNSMHPSTSGNLASFQFEQNIDVDLSSGVCKFNFKNPPQSNHM